MQQHCGLAGPSAAVALFGHQADCRRPSSTPCRRRQTLAVHCSIRARWSIDVRYGLKLDAVKHLQDWIQGIGVAAGLDLASARLNSGAIGPSESRLELEAEFRSVAAFDDFFASIPPTAHKAWSDTAKDFIIDGSPRWELFRACPLQESQTGFTPASTILEAWDRANEPPATPPSLEGPHFARPQLPLDDFDVKEALADEAPDGQHPEEGPRRKVVLDWKGEPMIINPGDRLPL